MTNLDKKECGCNNGEIIGTKGGCGICSPINMTNLKQLIEQQNKEFEEYWKTSESENMFMERHTIADFEEMSDTIKQLISSRQISLIKMIVDIGVFIYKTRKCLG